MKIDKEWQYEDDIHERGFIKDSKTHVIPSGGEGKNVLAAPQICLLVIDRAEATIATMQEDNIHILQYIYSQVPSKHGQGGQSQRRFERLIEIAFFNYYKRVAKHVAKHLSGCSEIIVGGLGITKDYFFGQHYLNADLREKVSQRFNVGYTDENGITELVEELSKANKLKPEVFFNA